MGRPADETNTIIQQLRISPQLAEDIEWFAQVLTEATPGATFSRTEAIRILLSRAITKAREDDAKPSRKRA